MSDQPGLPFGAASASDRPPTDEAARTRIRTELDRSMLVEAGAGSGKTHEMATRMAAGIAAGTYQIEHMAAVTFTRKAAAELRGRFQLALEAELAKAVDGSRQDRLRYALSNIERFFAGTIHAFCARLLRERPVEAGVAPGFTELDDAEEMMVRRQSWRDYRAQAKAAGDTDLLALLDAGVQPKHLDAAFDVVCQYEDVEFPPGDAKAPDGKAAWKALEKFWDELQKLLPPQIDPNTTCKLQQQVERFARAWKFATRNSKDDAGLVELLELWQSKPHVTQNRWPTRPIAKQAEALWDAFRTATVLPHLTQWRQYVYRLTVTLLDKARREAKKERLRRNALTFNDLLLMTADVLRRDAAVRRSLQQKYRWLFVDEFQDTDPVQAEIMFLLAPDCLFVVGDPKQSIYRFRRADIDIYNEVRDRLSGPDGSGLVKLTTNFRSVPGLCNWANGVFSNLFPPSHTPLSPMFAPLDSHREAKGSAPSLATLTTDSEPEAIARYIRSEVAAGRRKFGDFLILTRKKKGLQPYARALEALQVPIEVTGAGAFGESEEVRHLALLLEALADPQDAVALVGVLRGPLFGVSDRDLFAFRQAGGYFNLFSQVADTPSVPPPNSVSSALISLRQWYRWTRILPVGAALERIVEDSGMLALAAATPDGVEAGDLLHAIDRVRAIVEGGFTLADAADALASWSGLDPDGVKESTEVDSLPLQPGRPEVVRLMNLHKAKGLEAEVVFLADPDGGYPSTVDVRIERKPGAAAEGFFRIVQKSEQGWVVKVLGEPAGWDGYAATEQGYLDAEVHRLMYVAATRARDLLVIGRRPEGSGKSAAWAAFDPYLVGVPELVVPASVTLPPAATVDLTDAALNKVVESSAAAHARAQSASWAAVSVTSESKAFPRMTPGAIDEVLASDGGRVFRPGANDDPTRTVSDDTASRRADAGVAWGTLVHGLLEHAMRHPSATRDDLRRLAMWLTMEEPQLRVVIEQALDTVESVSRAEFWKTARVSAEVHEEAPFAIKEVREGRPTVVSGVIDLAYRDSAGWRILDYKTDADVDAEELQKRYAAQIEAYARAWRKTAGSASHATAVSTRGQDKR
jgi:ATP-dependent helicase/nuclease subunit A